ncbi:hypothetical protein GEO21_22175 [Sphingobacterium faecium]|uniref:hypothetical protein n=1 Tax=Sphingobacterium faecium TaxID=34087 RepID=UPI001291C4BC|nr:hypothetical protein [Sphingobacterium faecium]MQP30195.1 hypothetical protein [Sphingobacterium faecium]
MNKEDFKKLYALIIGINKIAYEMFENYLAFYSIRFNNNKEVTYQLPIALCMLMKNHYHIYVIEASKILHSGKNYFLLNKALNLIEKDPILAEKAILLRRKLNLYKSLIHKISNARNTIFAHLDEKFGSYKSEIDHSELDKLNEFIKEIIHFLNESIKIQPEFDYRNFGQTSITEFYDFVYTKITQTDDGKSLNSQEWF